MSEEATQPSDDDVAAAWEAMAAGEAEPATDGDGETVERVLNQNEIDSLLGLSASNDSQSSGVGLLVNSSQISYERLPMLEIVFDRLVRLLSTTLRNFTSDNVEVSLQTMESVRFGNYLDNVPLPCLIGVVKAVEWDSSIMLSVEPQLAYAIVDVLLGGRRAGTKTAKIEGRPFTTIECNLVERMMKLVLQDLSKAFMPMTAVTFGLERLETNPRFATIVRPVNAAIFIKVNVEMENRGGNIEFVIPYSTLEPIREMLLQMFMGEKFGQDNMWEGHLGREVWETEVTLDAILDKTMIPLNDVLQWEKGSQVVFAAKPDSILTIQCGDIPVMRGRIGQRNGAIAIQVEHNSLKQQGKGE